jgi:hypothetical protein
VLKKPEPTSGLEPLTCRLRNDPTLRMLLGDISGTEWFWCRQRFVQQFLEPEEPFPDSKNRQTARCCAVAYVESDLHRWCKSMAGGFQCVCEAWRCQFAAASNRCVGAAEHGRKYCLAHLASRRDSSSKRKARHRSSGLYAYLRRFLLPRLQLRPPRSLCRCDLPASCYRNGASCRSRASCFRCRHGSLPNLRPSRFLRPRHFPS